MEKKLCGLFGEVRVTAVQKSVGAMSPLCAAFGGGVYMLIYLLYIFLYFCISRHKIPVFLTSEN